MSRAHTRSSSRMSNISRTSNISTATSSSRLNTLLDDFDMRASTPIKVHTTNLLVPKRENPEYETLRKEVIRSRYRNKQDSAAVLIQKTMRMYLVKKRILATLQSHKKMRMKRILLFFNVILLNTTRIKFDRRKVYADVLSSATFLRKFYRGFTPASNEIYAATGMMTIPPYIDETMLIRFVYTFYRSRLRAILEEWHVATCKSRHLARYSKKFKFDQMSSIRFGIYYRTFAIWLNFTRIKRNRRLTSIDIPIWNYFMKNRLRKQQHLSKATEFRKKTICENAVQALRNVVLHHRHYKRFFEQAIEYNLKKSMKFALSAWIKYLILQQNKSITMRFVFRRWLQSVQRRKHLIMLSKALVKRHEYYQKRQIVDILAKNKKVSQCLNMYQYLRIMQKPSLALYFVSILRKDIYSESIAHTFTAWIGLVRRRRRWLHFVFMNEVISEYTPKKRLFLAALRHYALPTLTPICLYSDRFKKESMYMYHNVMNEKVDPSSIYLIVNGQTPDEVKKAASETKTRIQQREVFFQIWKSQKNNDYSLFMRSAVVYCAKKASITMRDAESIPDLCYKQYKKVQSFLAGMNIASDQKFRVALQTVEENNKKNLMNRMSCLHRDNLIILAHDSHSDAVDLHDVNSVFTNSDEFVKTKKIVEASEKLAQNFQPLIPIDKLGAVLEQPNEDQFVFVDGCRSHFKSFKPTIIECHNIIQRELVRSEIGHDVASRFDKLLSGHDLSSNAKNGAHSNSRVDSYMRYKGDKPPPKSRPSTGINDRLSSKFPQRNRKAKIIGKETETFSMSDLPPIDENNDEIPHRKHNEEEESVEKSDEKGGGGGSADFYKDDLGRLQRNKSFVNAFSNNEKTLLNSLMSRSQEKLEKYVPDNNEEEDHLMEELMKLRNQENSDDDSDPKFEIDQTLIDGFDRATMMSLKQVKDIQSPRTAKKYKLFLEILFGRAAKEVNNMQINKLRQRILSEFKNKKSSVATCGINTKNISRPVTGILEEYRRKDDLSPIHSIRGEKENKENKDNKDNQQQNNIDDENQYCQTYNSRRYKFLKKSYFDNNDESESKDKNSGKTSRSNEDDDDDENRNDDENQNQNENENNENDNENQNENQNQNNNENENNNDDDDNNSKNKKKFFDDDNENNNNNINNDDNSKNDNANKINQDSNSSDSEFRENLDDDDNREKKNFYVDIDDENEIGNYKEDENFEDTEFDPAAKEKVEKTNEEEEEDGEEIQSKIETNDGDKKKTDLKPLTTKKRRKSYRRISTATPYTSMNKNEGSPINKVDRIAIKLLSDQIPDENGYGMLVDVDPEQMPPLRLVKTDGSSFSENDEPTVFLPGYKDRKRIKVTSKLHKRTVPIVIPNKKEMTPNMKLVYHESDNFDKLLLVNGKSQYVHGNKNDSKSNFGSHHHLNGTNDSSEIDSLDRSGFIENQVVSFHGGGRQVGTQSPNFMQVRIQQGKQRGLIKPFILVESSSNAAFNSKKIKEQHSATSNLAVPRLKAFSSISKSNSNSTSASSNQSNSQLDNRAVSSHVRDLTTKIVNALAISSEGSEMFESFWQRSKDILKKHGSLVLNSNMADINHKIYESLIEINYDYNKDDNFFKTANGLFNLATKFSPFAPVLFDAAEKARKLAKQNKNSDQKKKQKNKDRFDLDFVSSGFETSWMADLDLNYNAVALQYREDNVKDENYANEKKNLDAIIASTNPSKAKAKRRPKTELLPERKWDDVLKNYNISDMMLVTPYIIPEDVVDDFLDDYRKSLKLQMH